MEEKFSDINSKSLPWWTWIAPFLIIETGDQLSLLFKYSEIYSAFYLPTAIAFVLIHWWGPTRVLPSMFIIGTLNSWFYDVQILWLWPVFGGIETFAVFISWFLFSKLMRGKSWLPDIKQTILFLSLGLIAPIIIEVALWQFAYLADHAYLPELFWQRFNRDLLSELIVNFSFALPALYFLTPYFHSVSLFIRSDYEKEQRHALQKKDVVEIIAIFIVLLILTFVLPFRDFWFLYGLFSLYFAIRFGFGVALLGNAYLFFISYLIPVLIQKAWINEYFLIDNSVISTFLGSILLYLFATITGRVISDLRIAEDQLHRQNEELKDANQELDRFVYSVSHDLSAPLKSILGLVNISKLSNNSEDLKIYFSKIEFSVVKLNTFIKEVLDYSQNKRLALTVEQIQLKDLCIEILENLKYMDSYADLNVDFSGLEEFEIKNDKTRVKMILNNLLTNAMKYQKHTPGHRPYIKISSRKKLNSVIIDVEDNGEGIRKEVQGKIFDMFFRGHEKSVGSGLGLYIAREAAEKIHGIISMKSEYGKGSTFSLELLNPN
ncbi:MAG: ATP-binding protein [Chryseolinea sp.]